MTKANEIIYIGIAEVIFCIGVMATCWLCAYTFNDNFRENTDIEACKRVIDRPIEPLVGSGND